MNWQPIAHPTPAKLCHHAHNTPQGWVNDCDEQAAFVATDPEDGSTWYSCTGHAQEMSKL